MTEPMAPQPYPLWCVQASRTKGIFAGRIVGWDRSFEDNDTSPDGDTLDFQPIVVSSQPDDGTVSGIGPPFDYDKMFIGDDQEVLIGQARRWLHGQGVEMDPAPGTTYALDSAMHSVWLHGDWRWLTRKMATEEREAAADAVDRYHVILNDDENLAGLDQANLRWWR